MYYKGEKMKQGASQSTDFHGYGPSIRARVSELLPGDGDVRVLDVGTGMASSIKLLLELLSKGSHVWTLDPSSDALAGARTSLITKDRRRVSFVQGVADGLGFETDFFDIVVCVMAMHHITNMPGSVAEMSRVTRKGGRLIVIDYSPEAHSLEFQSRHAKEDFFTAVEVSEVARASGLIPRVEDHDKWYLVEAEKAQ